jgi:hypothetical protein
MHNGKKVQVGLEHQVRQWPPPTAGDDRGPSAGWEAAHARHAANGVNKQMGLRDMAPRWNCFSPPVPGTPAGLTSSPSSRVLNPQFVEWLMGWPIGWTDLENAGTGSSAWLQRARGWLSTLCTETPEAHGRLL